MPWITFEHLFFFFPAAITFHNLEEAIWLPDWSQNAGRWHRPVEKVPFRFAVGVLTLLAYLFTFLGLMGGKQSVGMYLLSGYALLMLINVFFPHLIAAVWLKQYVPGLVTGLSLNLPVCSGLLIFALKEEYVSPWPLLITGCLFFIGILLLIPRLFKWGEKIEERYLR